MESQEKMKTIVEKILEKDERSRSDDRWLVYCVYRKLTKIFIPFEDFEKLPSPESVTRCRRQIQNKEGRFKADKRTQIIRVFMEDEFRKHYSAKESVVVK